MGNLRQIKLGLLWGALALLTFSSCKPYIDTSSTSAPLASAMCLGTTFNGVAGTAICNGVSNTVTSMSSAASQTSTTATYTPASGTAYSSFTVDLGSGFQAGNVCSSASIFGLAGTASCSVSGSTTVVTINSVLQSNALRNITSPQITQAAEVGTAAASGLGTGYRDTPISISDDEGAYWVGYCASNTATTQTACTALGGTYTWLSSICVDPGYTTQAACNGAGGSHTWVQNTGSTCTNATQGADGNSCSTSYPIMLSTHNAFQDCGGNAFANIAASVANCASVNGAQATWNGSVLGGHGEGTWAMVAHKGGAGSNKEVWQDQRTGLIWSSLATTTAKWCLASGNAETPANGGTNCTPGGAIQTNPATSYCAETSGQVPGFAGDTGGQWQLGGRTYDNAKGGMGLQSSLAVHWRLPTKYDYEQADVDGIRYVMPDMGAFSPWEWSASLYSSNRSIAWVFYGYAGSVTNTIRSNTYAIRCIGR